MAYGNVFIESNLHHKPACCQPLMMKAPPKSLATATVRCTLREIYMIFLEIESISRMHRSVHRGDLSLLSQRHNVDNDYPLRIGQEKKDRIFEL